MIEVETESLTIEILKGIRDEIKTTNVRLGSVEQEIKGLGLRQTQMETRLATELLSVVQAVNEVGDLLRDQPIYGAESMITTCG